MKTKPQVVLPPDQPMERFLLGLPDMDEQHRYLYELFDRLEPAPAVTDAAATRKLLTALEQYILYHFACEEHLMRMYQFPHFAPHKADHESAEDKLGQFLHDFEHHRLNPARLRLFLTGWLMEHSQSSDAQYAPWIKKCRAELAAAVPQPADG